MSITSDKLQILGCIFGGGRGAENEIIPPNVICEKTAISLITAEESEVPDC